MSEQLAGGPFWRNSPELLDIGVGGIVGVIEHELDARRAYIYTVAGRFCAGKRRPTVPLYNEDGHLVGPRFRRPRRTSAEG